jgi:hypothetical protein
MTTTRSRAGVGGAGNTGNPQAGHTDIAEVTRTGAASANTTSSGAVIPAACKRLPFVRYDGGHWDAATGGRSCHPGYVGEAAAA